MYRFEEEDFNRLRHSDSLHPEQGGDFSTETEPETGGSEFNVPFPKEHPTHDCKCGALC